MQLFDLSDVGGLGGKLGASTIQCFDCNESGRYAKDCSNK